MSNIIRHIISRHQTPFLPEPRIHRLFELRWLAILDINEIISTLAFTIFSPSLAAIFSISSKVLADVYHKVVYVLGYVSSVLCCFNLLMDCHMSSR